MIQIDGELSLSILLEFVTAWTRDAPNVLKRLRGAQFVETLLYQLRSTRAITPHTEFLVAAHSLELRGAKDDVQRRPLIIRLSVLV